MDLPYDFYFKHKMEAVEWKSNAMIKKDERLINKLNRNWKHSLIRKFEHAPVSNEQ